jgi:FkbM family methyltransferase
MLRITRIKNGIRDAIPHNYVVPVKYLYSKITGTLEPEVELIRRFVTRGDHVVDVGGNRGLYSYAFWRLGLRVEVFEPNEECLLGLEAWAHGKSNVNVHGVGLSSHQTSAVLQVPVDDSGVVHDSSGSLEKSDSGGFIGQHVQLKRLDDYGFKDLKFIKIDVEGHEVSVIEGAKNTIETSMPTLLVEIEQRHNRSQLIEVFTRILDFGYRGYFLRNKQLHSISTFDLLIDQDIENIGKLDHSYINNFLFLDKSMAESV